MPKRLTPSVLLRMTRPGFLTVTAACVLLGWACTRASGLELDWRSALATLLLALTAHAAANALNDSEDFRNGADAANRDAIAPFSGGSGLILRGETTDGLTRRVAWSLLAITALGGSWLAWRAGPAIWLIGIAGLLIAWAYSAPPFKLMSRGLGEPAIAVAWWLVTVGSDAVQRSGTSQLAMIAAIGPALLIANILLINGYPDARSDAQVGKRTLVVRLGATRAALLYALIATATLIPPWLLVVQQGITAAWIGTASSIPSAAAFLLLWRHRDTPSSMRPAIILTLVAALLHCALLGTALAMRT